MITISHKKAGRLVLRNLKITDLLKYCHEYELKNDIFVQVCRKAKKPSNEMKCFLQKYEAEKLRNPNIVFKEHGDCSPLHLAVYLGDVPATKYLLARSAMPGKNRAGQYQHQMELDESRANQPEYVARYKEARRLVATNCTYLRNMKQSIKGQQAADRRIHQLWLQEQQQITQRKAEREQQHRAEMHRRYAESMARSERIRDSMQASMNDWIKRREIENKAFAKSLDKMANINQPPQVQPTKSVAFQSPLYSLQDCPRSGGLPIQKTTSIFLASNTHPESFTGFNGAQCSYNDILYAGQLVNNASEGAGNWGATVSNQIDKYVHQDSKWECAPENIQPSTSSKPR